MFDGLRHPHGTAREVATDLSLVRSKVAKVVLTMLTGMVSYSIFHDYCGVVSCSVMLYFVCFVV